VRAFRAIHSHPDGPFPALLGAVTALSNLMVTYSIECAEVEGNTMNGLWEHAIGIATAFAAVVVFDLPLRAFFSASKTRWFALHSLVNIAISAMCLLDLVGVIRAPLCAMVEPTSSWFPSYAAFSLHLYHLTCFTALRLEDIVHHVLFAGGLGVFNFAIAWGRMTNLLIFFMTGLPGAIDYGMLVFVKTGKLKRLTQKSITSSINTWLRAPGHVFTATIMAICTWHHMTGAVPYPAAVVGAVASLCLLNGIYYGEQAVGSYHKMAALSPLYAAKQAGMNGSC
jgi:hypothetical protein